MPNIVEFKNGELLVWVWTSANPDFSVKMKRILELESKTHDNKDKIGLIEEIFSYNKQAYLLTNEEFQSNDLMYFSALVLHQFRGDILFHNRVCYSSDFGYDLSMLGTNLQGHYDDGVAVGIYVISRPQNNFQTMNQFDALLKQAIIRIKE
jgi:hypothetical protein